MKTACYLFASISIVVSAICAYCATVVSRGLIPDVARVDAIVYLIGVFSYAGFALWLRDMARH